MSFCGVPGRRLAQRDGVDAISYLPTIVITVWDSLHLPRLHGVG
jgi:hypothetical protein